MTALAPITPPEAAALHSKIAKQKHEIARLTRDAEIMRAEAKELRFELHKARAALRQKAEGS